MASSGGHNSPPIELRPLRAGEGLAYRAVRLRALEQAPEAYGRTLAEELNEPGGVWHDLAARTAADDASTLFVLDRGGGTLAGTAYVRVDERAPYLAHIGAMWVDEDLRAAGWADLLIETAEAWAQRLGAPGALLWVAMVNERAWRFYTRHGYVPTGAVEPRGTSGGESRELYHAFDSL